MPTRPRAPPRRRPGRGSAHPIRRASVHALLVVGHRGPGWLPASADVTRISSAALSSGVAGLAGAMAPPVFGYLWLAFGGVPVLRMAAEKTAVRRRGCRVVRAGQPPVAHSGQQHFDGQIPAAFARVSADVPGREHDSRPVDVVAVKQRENVGEVLPLRGIDPTRRSAACRRACLDTRSAVRRRRLPWRERVGAPERGRCRQVWFRWPEPQRCAGYWASSDTAASSPSKSSPQGPHARKCAAMPG